MRERLAEIKAEQDAGQYAQALQQVEPLVPRAEALGYAPLLAEVKFRRGTLLEHYGEYAEADGLARQPAAAGTAPAVVGRLLTSHVDPPV